LRSVKIYEHGSFDVLNVEDCNEPRCLSGTLKIKIKAAAINHLDLWVRNGIAGFKTKFPIILGSDAAGTIVDIGSEVEGWKEGQDVVVQPIIFCNNCKYCKSNNQNNCQDFRIIGETDNGVMSDYILLKPQNIYRKPENLNYEEAASMQLVFMTAYHMLVEKAKLKKDEAVFIYGGTSGVGSAAIQIAKDIGAKVVASVGSDKKIDHPLKMGANNVIIHNNDLEANIKKSIINKFDVVFEHIGKDTWDISLKILRNGGRIVTCGATTGASVNLKLNHLFYKNLSILGSTMSNLRTFYAVQKKIADKVYFPFVDKVFTVDKIRQAHKYIEERNHQGKVIIKF